MTNHLYVYHARTLVAVFPIVPRFVHAFLFVKATFVEAAPSLKSSCFCNVLQLIKALGLGTTADPLCAFMLNLQVLNYLLMGVSVQTNILSLLRDRLCCM